MTRRIALGIVGIGFGQHVLVPAFRSDSRFSVEAICATTLERARHVAARLAIPTAYGDWQALVADPKIEAVAIATPPAQQPAITIAAARQRKHVFCEKPLATTVEAAAEMLDAVRDAAVAHMTDFEFSAVAPWQEAKRRLKERALGQLRHVVVSWQVETYATRHRITSWKTDTERGGGTLNAFGSHVLYNVEWLLGPVKRISARLLEGDGGRGGARGDRVALLWLLLSDGTPVSVSISSDASPGTGHRMEIYGDRGSLVLKNTSTDYVDGFELVSGSSESRRWETIHVPRTNRLTADGRIAAVGGLVSRFADWIDQEIPSAPSLDDGYRVQCLLDAARQSDATGAWCDTPSTVSRPVTAITG